MLSDQEVRLSLSLFLWQPLCPQRPHEWNSRFTTPKSPSVPSSVHLWASISISQIPKTLSRKDLLVLHNDIPFLWPSPGHPEVWLKNMAYSFPKLWQDCTCEQNKTGSQVVWVLTPGLPLPGCVRNSTGGKMGIKLLRTIKRQEIK